MKKPGYVRRGRFILEKYVPFQALLPLKLKTSVSGKGDISASASCVQEMSILFACFKKNNFNEMPCSKEVTEFKKCWTEHATSQRKNKLHEKEGELSPGDNKLSHRQVSALLQKFP